LFNRTEKDFWKMTPAQFYWLTEVHVELNTPEEDKKSRRRKTKNHFDPDRPESIYGFEQLSKIKLPAGR